MYALGYDWKYADEWPTSTMEGFQEKLLATKRGSSNPPTFQPPLTVIVLVFLKLGRVHYLMP